MSVHDERTSEFERRTGAVLEESVTRIDARIRSRLNQARNAALAEAARRRPPLWRSFMLLPAAGTVAAAVLIAVALWVVRPEREVPFNEGIPTTLEDLDLFVDGETLELIEGWDNGFYEWAAAQADMSGEASG